MIDVLTKLPSGAWVVFGGLLTLLGTVLIESWRSRREDKNAKRARAEAVDDRTRQELLSAFSDFWRGVAGLQHVVSERTGGSRGLFEPLPDIMSGTPADSALMAAVAAAEADSSRVSILCGADLRAILYDWDGVLTSLRQGNRATSVDLRNIARQSRRIKTAMTSELAIGETLGAGAEPLTPTDGGEARG